MPFNSITVRPLIVILVMVLYFLTLLQIMPLIILNWVNNLTINIKTNSAKLEGRGKPGGPKVETQEFIKY